MSTTVVPGKQDRQLLRGRGREGLTWVSHNWTLYYWTTTVTYTTTFSDNMAKQKLLPI